MTDNETVTGTSELGASDCWALLRSCEVGRLAVSVDDRPDIFPLNYVVDHGVIVVRTAKGSKLSAAIANPQVAFEVDSCSALAGQAWSVVLKGVLEPIEHVDDLIDVMGPDLSPWHTVAGQRYVRLVPVEQRRLDGLLRAWAPGLQDAFIRIPLQVVSGRQLQGIPMAPAAVSPSYGRSAAVEPGARQAAG